MFNHTLPRILQVGEIKNIDITTLTAFGVIYGQLGKKTEWNGFELRENAQILIIANFWITPPALVGQFFFYVLILDHHILKFMKAGTFSVFYDN